MDERHTCHEGPSRVNDPRHRWTLSFNVIVGPWNQYCCPLLVATMIRGPVFGRSVLLGQACVTSNRGAHATTSIGLARHSWTLSTLHSKLTREGLVYLQASARAVTAQGEPFLQQRTTVSHRGLQSFHLKVQICPTSTRRATNGLQGSLSTIITYKRHVFSHSLWKASHFLML